MKSWVYFLLCLFSLGTYSLSLESDIGHGDDESFTFKDWDSVQDCAWLVEGGHAIHKQSEFCDRVMNGKVLWNECKKVCQEITHRHLQLQLVSTSQVPSMSTSQSPHPTNNKSSTPSTIPSDNPTHTLSNRQSFDPSISPSNVPTRNQSPSPSHHQTNVPSINPTQRPSVDPSTSPSDFPTSNPSQSPSQHPTNVPTVNPTEGPTPTPPNLIIIYTDEHNYRTLGSYRKILSQKQAFIWGDKVKLDTPNIDSIANEGVLFTNMFTASPLCTPARASFLSGMYPPSTGAWENQRPLFDNVTTFAQVLNDAGWETGYIGKWHLAGPARPGWASSNDNVYGFSSAKYLYNRGHWKFFEDVNDEVIGYNYNDETQHKFKNTMEENFSTDFLVDRGIDFIRERTLHDKPFALMISIPDPHDPVQVRPPYDTMFDHLEFEVPRTAIAALKKDPALPNWSSVAQMKKVIKVNWKKVAVQRAWTRQKEIKESIRRRHILQHIFAMIKCIDDNVGKLLSYLKEAGLDENTIVVFSSDHGDSMGEHLRHNKLTPYDTSAGIPLMIRYPGHIAAGKVIKTAYSSIDFAPTILKIMGVNHNVPFHGADGSTEVLSPSLLTNNDDKMIFMTSASKNMWWASGMTSKYKLVLSENDVPWFFDRDQDPDELINYHGEANIKSVKDEMRQELLSVMTEYDFPLQDHPFLLQDPACIDSPNFFLRKSDSQRWDCTLAPVNSDKRQEWCQDQNTAAACPVTCSKCMQDSTGSLWLDSGEKECSYVQNNPSSCDGFAVHQFCLSTCTNNAIVF